MRLLPLVVLLCACATGEDTGTGVKGEEEDTAPPKVDTGVALVYFEGSAALGDDGWVGLEDWVATTTNGAVEHCRVQNMLTGDAAPIELCPGCTFAFAVEARLGTLTGDACENVGFTEDMFDGLQWIYAFAPSYVYGVDYYSYENVLLYGYFTDDGDIRWTMTAFAETDGESVIDYEAVYADLWTYYYL